MKGYFRIRHFCDCVQAIFRDNYPGQVDVIDFRAVLQAEKRDIFGGVAAHLFQPFPKVVVHVFEQAAVAHHECPSVNIVSRGLVFSIKVVGQQQILKRGRLAGVMRFDPGIGDLAMRVGGKPLVEGHEG